jgi:hypothetical protein
VKSDDAPPQGTQLESVVSILATFLGEVHGQIPHSLHSVTVLEIEEMFKSGSPGAKNLYTCQMVLPSAPIPFRQ